MFTVIFITCFNLFLNHFIFCFLFWVVKESLKTYGIIIMIIVNCLWMVLWNNNNIWFGLDDATMWHISINYMMILYDDFYMIMRCHKDTMMLRSTTGSYGWPVIKVAYGEIMIHSTEAVWEILAREEWLGCRHNTSRMFNIPGSTPMWAPYIIFSGFHDIKISMYYVLISIRIKKNTDGLWSHLGLMKFKKYFSTAHMF